MTWITEQVMSRMADSRGGIQMYNWSVQDAIAAFVDSLKPDFPHHEMLYQQGLTDMGSALSNLLTALGYPPIS